MEFINNERHLKKLLRLPNDRKVVKNGKEKFYPTFHKGLYFVKRKRYSKFYITGMSHGAGGLFQRLKSYKKCMPLKGEFILKYLVICRIGKDAIELEKQFIKRHRGFVSVDISYEEYEESEGLRSKEIKITSSEASFKKLFDTILTKNENINLWQYVIVFNENGWKIIRNDGSNNLNLQRPSKRYNKKPKI